MLVSEHSGMSCSQCNGRDVCSLYFLKHCLKQSIMIWALDNIEILSLFSGCSSNSNNKQLYVSLNEWRLVVVNPCLERRHVWLWSTKLAGCWWCCRGDSVRYCVNTLTMSWTRASHTQRQQVIKRPGVATALQCLHFHSPLILIFRPACNKTRQSTLLHESCILENMIAKDKFE